MPRPLPPESGRGDPPISLIPVRRTDGGIVYVVPSEAAKMEADAAQFAHTAREAPGVLGLGLLLEFLLKDEAERERKRRRKALSARWARLARRSK